jgi:hypothetical protein
MQDDGEILHSCGCNVYIRPCNAAAFRSLLVLQAAQQQQDSHGHGQLARHFAILPAAAVAATAAAYASEVIIACGLG